jgi:hypothetical protein
LTTLFILWIIAHCLTWYSLQLSQLLTLTIWRDNDVLYNSSLEKNNKEIIVISVLADFSYLCFSANIPVTYNITRSVLG